ncbi:MAG: indole-3-glycerol-phosphate synthase TrpC, partial [Firmicutes bacterium HGW-Firmicutes-3]
DFIVQANQVYHARAIGASCILLIVAILTDVQLREYSMLAKSLGMDVLVETHTKDEIQRALKGDVSIIGINNRNLKTFKTDIGTTLKLRRYVPKDRLVISESGIHKPEDITLLKKVDINGILVGESFMRGDIGLMAKAFKEAYDG